MQPHKKYCQKMYFNIYVSDCTYFSSQVVSLDCKVRYLPPTSNKDTFFSYLCKKNILFYAYHGQITSIVDPGTCVQNMIHTWSEQIHNKIKKYSVSFGHVSTDAIIYGLLLSEKVFYLMTKSIHFTALVSLTCWQ